MFSFFKKKISEVLHSMQDHPPAVEPVQEADATLPVADAAPNAAAETAAEIRTETVADGAHEATPAAVPADTADFVQQAATAPQEPTLAQDAAIASPALHATQPAATLEAATVPTVPATAVVAQPIDLPQTIETKEVVAQPAEPLAPVVSASLVIDQTPEPAPAVAPVVTEPAEPEPAVQNRNDWLGRLKAGLKKTGSSIGAAFGVSQVDESLYEELEDALLMADAGVQATQFLLADLRQRVKAARASEPAQVRALLVDAIADLLQPLQKPLVIGEHTPTVIMVAGVNGAGKTTSISKLTRHLSQAGQNVLLAAADTFRAAAREQLAVWADRNRVEIVSSAGGDPAALSFDAVSAGKARQRDVVLVDTAGRLPTQIHLMDELKKIRRTITKADATAPHEVLLVIDGNTGQNALMQTKAFDDALQLTGLIVTKLDGTAKGGVLCAIARERPVPVYFVGVGETLEDLQTFHAREFAEALLGE